MLLILVLLYLFLCGLTALLGTDRRMGFVGTFVLAVIITPLLVLPLLFITGPSRHIEWRRRD
jgi:Sec-independent protein secretion pathway component TatC